MKTGDLLHFGPVTILNTGKVETNQNFRVYHLEVRLSKGADPHPVRLIWWDTWADKQLPENPAALVQFIRKDLPATRKSLFEETGLNSPVMVHCSAGIGRTGENDT